MLEKTKRVGNEALGYGASFILLTFILGFICSLAGASIEGAIDGPDWQWIDHGDGSGRLVDLWRPEIGHKIGVTIGVILAALFTKPFKGAMEDYHGK